MKSLFLTAPCLLVAILTVNLADTIQSDFTSNCSSDFCHKQYVFVIDIWNRDRQTDVENLANWRFLGQVNDIPRCGPGNLQACQLVVDERDTKLSKEGEPVLNSCVRISALLNKKAKVWYVSNYTPIGSYPYQILNEENEID